MDVMTGCDIFLTSMFTCGRLAAAQKMMNTVLKRWACVARNDKTELQASYTVLKVGLKLRCCSQLGSLGDTSRPAIVVSRSTDNCCTRRKAFQALKNAENVDRFDSNNVHHDACQEIAGHDACCLSQ